MFGYPFLAFNRLASPPPPTTHTMPYPGTMPTWHEALGVTEVAEHTSGVCFHPPDAAILVAKAVLCTLPLPLSLSPDLTSTSGSVPALCICLFFP